MLNSVIVTREMLIGDNACDPAMEAFDEAFPNGSATLQEIVEHKLCEPKWLGWLAVNGSFLTEEIAMELLPLLNNPGYYYGEAAVRAHWVTAETGPRLIMLSDDPHLTFGRASAFAHWVTAEIGPGMISKSSEPPRFAVLATIYAEWMTAEIEAELAELVAKYRL